MMVLVHLVAQVVLLHLVLALALDLVAMHQVLAVQAMHLQVLHLAAIQEVVAHQVVTTATIQAVEVVATQAVGQQEVVTLLLQETPEGMTTETTIETITTTIQDTVARHHRSQKQHLGMCSSRSFLKQRSWGLKWCNCGHCLRAKLSCID